MRYFTRGWANGELTDEESDAVCGAYEARVAEITPLLPPSMLCLLRGASLHDAIIESVQWTPSRAELRLELVGDDISEVGYQTIELTYRGAMLGAARIASLRNAASDREACILYQEIDIADEGVLAHRLLFWPNEEVTIEFREFDYASAPRNDRRVTLSGAFVVVDEVEDAAEHGSDGGRVGAGNSAGRGGVVAAGCSREPNSSRHESARRMSESASAMLLSTSSAGSRSTR